VCDKGKILGDGTCKCFSRQDWRGQNNKGSGRPRRGTVRELYYHTVTGVKHDAFNGKLHEAFLHRLCFVILYRFARCLWLDQPESSFAAQGWRLARAIDNKFRLSTMRLPFLRVFSLSRP
jgi:hypothetical protein